jgi:Family of unknown function (DUF6166)
MKKKWYRGVRNYSWCRVWVQHDVAFGVLLDPRHDLRKHGRGYYNWGYDDEGSAQLALALAADVLGDGGNALRIYQGLKAELVAREERSEWEYTHEELLGRCNRLLLESQARNPEGQESGPCAEPKNPLEGTVWREQDRPEHLRRRRKEQE